MEAQKSDAALWEIAKERAERACPYPRHYPSWMGIYGALLTALPVMLFKGFAGLDGDSFTFATFATIGLGFLGPWGYIKLQQRRHFKAISKEYASLKESR
jgi:hypothetical protein